MAKTKSNTPSTKRSTKVGAGTEKKQIKIKLVRSLIGASETQRRTVAGLGLSKKDQVVEHYDSPTILGMINKVAHLVQITE